MHARFYAPSLAPGTGRVDLDADESHHLAHVLRLAAGAEVLAFNGHGLQVRARVGHVGRRLVSLEVVGPEPAAAERSVRVTLAQAVLKGDRMDSAMRDAAMMGVAAIVPVIAARTIGPSRTLRSGRQLDRWGRLAVSGAKQCGRAVVPRVGAPLPLVEFLDAPLPTTRLVLVEPSLGSATSRDLERQARQAADGGAVVLVGPEGGWTEDEIACATSAGFEPWSLGSLTLRADAVPIAALAVLYYAWDASRPAARGDGLRP